MSLYQNLYLPIFYASIQLLENNDAEWVSRYHYYIDGLNIMIPTINKAKSKFGSSPYLDIYLPLNKALKYIDGSKQETDLKVSFDVRYKGQNVAELNIVNDDIILRINTDKNARCFSDYPDCLKAIPDGSKLGWHSNEAKLFRKYFAGLPERTNGSRQYLERYFESQLQKQLSMDTAKARYVHNIQLIGIFGKRFQMPTPLMASMAKNGILTYADDQGGGIDILARQGRGKRCFLTVIELKDECKASEPPEKAIMQAIAYATFLRELLREPKASANQWWQFFGFHKAIPDELKIQAVIAMPKGKYNCTCFSGQRLNFSQSNCHPGDHIELHYLYFDVDQSNHTITGIASTSL